jgi:hypothetical protein
MQLVQRCGGVAKKRSLGAFFHTEEACYISQTPLSLPYRAFLCLHNLKCGIQAAKGRKLSWRLLHNFNNNFQVLENTKKVKIIYLKVEYADDLLENLIVHMDLID